MEKLESQRNFVESQHVPKLVEISGFEAVDENVHMLEWIRKGRDFRQFVVNDIENELYDQDGSSQLLFVRCKEKPNFEIKAKTDHQKKNGVLTEFFVLFPVSLRVQSTNGVIWKLEVEHSYQAISIDKPDQFQLRLNFTIVSHQIES